MVVCCTVSHHRLFVGREEDPGCFRVPKEAVVQRFAKAASDDETNAELSREAVEAAVRVAFLGPEVVTAYPL